MPFVVAHIDSLIMIGLGIAFLVTNVSKPGENEGRRKLIRVLAVIMVAAGALMLLSPAAGGKPSSGASDKPTSGASEKPVIQSTDDGVATVSFPGTPTKTIVAAAQTPDGHDRETYRYAPEGRDLDFRLSRSAMDPEALSIPPAQRVEIITSGLQKKGFLISDRTTSNTPVAIYGFTSAAPDGTAVSFFRIGFVGNQLYRVIATQGKGETSHDGFEPFLASFQLRPKLAQPNQAAAPLAVQR